MKWSRFKTWSKGGKSAAQFNASDPARDGAMPGEGASPDRSEPSPLLPSAQVELLKLARDTLIRVAAFQDLPEPAGLAPRLHCPQACFVTLTRAEELRGCVGHIHPRAPLYQAVMENTRSAATRDPRFSPVQPGEVREIRIEISVLSTVRRLQYESPEDLLGQLRPDLDGVVFQCGGHTATFLPQVWEQFRDKPAFLERLAQKAGCRASAWRDPETILSTYQVDAFEERD